MSRRSLFPLLALSLALALAPAHPASAVERSQIPDRLKWDVTALYPSEQAWKAALDEFTARVPSLARFQGHLGDSADSLQAALDAWMDLMQLGQRVYTYAAMLSDQDTRVAHTREMRQSAQQQFIRLHETASYLRPEILAVGADKVHQFVAADPGLAQYRHFLDDILRWAPHTLPAEQEALVAKASVMSGAAENIRDIFINGEMPYPTVVLSNGDTVRVDDAAYTQYRASTVRADRDTVFREFWERHREFQGTFGAAIDAQMKAHVFDMEVHHFDSCMQEALFGDNIPTSVYSQLISDVHANLPTLHRYLELRRRIMKLDTLRYEDLYAPLVSTVDLKYTREQAERLVLAAVAPLGKDYVETLRKGLDDGWVDWMPSTGKASGAYSTGAYGVHPYQLQNFTGLYDDVSTLAHESGHSMHTDLADSHQPFVNHDYATFVAEVASTLNENLLFHYMLDHTKDKATRLYLLGNFLEILRGTLFRQVLFAEFELQIHQAAERGEPLTGEKLSAMYLKLVREYYGDAQGICKVDALYGTEWTFVDHFFYDFYVYQYATSIVASTAIANGIRDEAAHGKGRPRRDAYLAMLESGSSKYPIDLLKGAGVDMTTSGPFNAAMKEMNSVMDQIERIIAK